MGLTYVDAELAEPSRPSRRERVRFLVDSGAIYSLAPAPILRRLGIRPLRREEFELADGSTMRRLVGLALFRVSNKLGGSEVIFGGPRDEPLLGAVTLEALGLEADPVRRRLRRTRLLMVPGRGAPREREAIELALREVTGRRRRARIIEHAGKIDLALSVKDLLRLRSQG